MPSIPWGKNLIFEGYKNATDAELVTKMIRSIPNDLLKRVLEKLKPDYEIFNYPLEGLGPEIIGNVRILEKFN